MHLAELLTLGARPGAGLLLALTARCPLSCSHCSTDSSMSSPQYGAAPFLRLVDSFEADDADDPGAGRPDALLMSGGEPLLRPGLVRDLARRARRAGTRSALLSGMFFARGDGRVPPAVAAAIGELDHFAASIDAPHEREVPRGRVFAALAAMLDLVPAASLHVTVPPGAGPGPDAWTDALVAEVRNRFGERLPLLVSTVRPTGRAARGAVPRPPVPGAPSPRPSGHGPLPCPFAAWPLVDVDGTVHACTRQSLVRTDPPAHLVLGHAGRDPWRTLRGRALDRPVLRAVRTFGPSATRDRFADVPPATGAGDPCGACLTLSDGGVPERAAAFLASPSGARTEAAVRMLLAARPPRALAAARGASPHYAHLTELGWSGEP